MARPGSARWQEHRSCRVSAQSSPSWATPDRPRVAESCQAAFGRKCGLLDNHSCLTALQTANYSGLAQTRAAFDTSKLSSSI